MINEGTLIMIGDEKLRKFGIPLTTCLLETIEGTLKLVH